MVLSPLPDWPPMEHHVPVLRPCPKGCGNLRFYLCKRYQRKHCRACRNALDRRQMARPERRQRQLARRRARYALRVLRSAF